MNYSIQKLINDFVSRVGDDDLKMLETVPPQTAFNYVYFLYKKFYEAYPTGEVYSALSDMFAKQKAA